MFLIFTGDGKGKTTAALGQALRASGEGKRVLMVQFIKGPWKSGEDESARHIPDFNLMKMGKGFVGIMGDKLPIEEHKKAAAEALAFTQAEIDSGKWHMVILDEVMNAIGLKLINEEEVAALAKRAEGKIEHLILTGRGAPEGLVAMADLVTEMKEVKHPYGQGVKGRRGLEY